jgi:F-type H+-transporting ATPase subunit b
MAAWMSTSSARAADPPKADSPKADSPKAEATKADFEKKADAGHGDAAHGDAGHGDAGHGGDGHGHSDVDSNPLEFRTDLAIWTAVVFLTLFFVLAKFAWGPISEGLDKREHSIAHNIAQAQQHHEEAKSLLAEHQKKLAGAAEEVRAIIEEARRDGERTMQELIQKGQAEVQALRDRTLREVDTAKAQALKDLAERSTELAVELAGKLVREKLRPEDHTRLIGEALEKFATARPSSN